MKRLGLVLLCQLATQQLVAQPQPVIRTSREKLTLYMNGERSNFSGIDRLPRTFAYGFDIEPTGMPMSIVSETDSIAFTIRLTQPVTFRIVREPKGDTVVCTFSGAIKKAAFSPAYIASHKGKSFIEVPEVYELINVLYALTAEGRTDQDIIDKHTAYYRQVQTYFKPVQQHPAVARFDSLLKAGQYNQLKMDSYAYVFQGDELKKDGSFDRISWGDVNTLDKHRLLVADFAKRANFRAFFRKNQPYYSQLKRDFQQTIPLADMKQWLDRQFPKTSYDCVKVIASPLVGANQSANWFEDNGFRETQAHINLPGPLKPSDDAVVRAQRQEIVFTELNHAYENPEAEHYGKEINGYFGDLAKWTAGKASGSYQNAFLCFQEYMNWALVTLYHDDHLKGTDFTTLCTNVERMMVERRGFSKFQAFNQALLQLYRNRKPTETVADLYPSMLAWAAKQ